MTDTQLKEKYPKVIYELIPFVCILSGVVLLHGVSSMIQLGVGILQLVIGAIILSVRCEYRYNNHTKNTSDQQRNRHG